jgi:hypothetical protein
MIFECKNEDVFALFIFLIISELEDIEIKNTLKIT